MGREPLPRLLDDGQLDTLALRKGDPRLGSLSDREHVAQPSSKLMALGILDVNGLETSLMLFTILDNSDPSPVPSPGNHDNVSNIKFDELGDLVGLEVEFDGVISLDQRVWIANGTAIVGVEVWDAFLPKLD